MSALDDTTIALEGQLGVAAAERPLDALTAISSLRTMLTTHEWEAVRAALTEHTWSEIGRALGVSKQAAFQRFGKQWIREIRPTMSTSEMKTAIRRRLSTDDRTAAPTR